MSRFISVLLLSICVLLSAATSVQAAEQVGARPAEPRRGWNFRDAALIPVQSGGRVKPLDTFAREIMLFQTGSRFYSGWDPVDLLFSFMTMPEAWETREFITVGRKDVKRQIGLDEEKTRFSPKELFADSYLAQYAGEAETSKPPMAANVVGSKPKEDPREQELKRTVERLVLFRRIASGSAWPVVPGNTADEPWRPLSGQDNEGNEIRAAFARMAVAYYRDDRDSFEVAAQQARQAVHSRIPATEPQSWGQLESKLTAELAYNRGHPFLWAWILYLTSALVGLGAILLGRASGEEAPLTRLTRRSALGLAVAGVLSHLVGFLLRCYVAGRPPVSNMYESIIWVSFGVLLFGFVLYRSQRQAVILITACFLGTLGMLAADSAPAMMDPGIHPLVPVLRSNYWLTVHVLTITISYAAFALAMGLANVSLGYFIRGRSGFMAKVENLNQLTYRAQQFGVVLLAAGTILGGVWADYSWGRFWGWDPKEVWALIALLNYLVILHGRYTNWVGQFGFAMWSVLAFMGVVMAWYGVNFVLGVGLHSYGFSTGGRGVVGAFCLAQMLYCGLAAFRQRQIRAELRLARQG
jgi:cytochrome c-type biogenesis protein CcsB